eukprot:Hpha_TRINITY_DN28908_c0_g1::TRINITY_DN28908_c0_g1_i1::g.19476::m.19476
MPAEDNSITRQMSTENGDMRSRAGSAFVALGPEPHTHPTSRRSSVFSLQPDHSVRGGAAAISLPCDSVGVFSLQPDHSIRGGAAAISLPSDSVGPEFAPANLQDPEHSLRGDAACLALPTDTVS